MSEDKFYGLIADELEQNLPNRVLWTKAFGEAGGDVEKAKAFYIKLRLIDLKKSEQPAKTPPLSPSSSFSPTLSTENGLALMRGKLAETLARKKIASFYSTLNITAEVTDAEVALAIIDHEAKIDAGAALATPEFKYAKETLGKPKARERYDRQLFERVTPVTSVPSRALIPNEGNSVASDHIMLSLWESRKSTVIIGVVSLCVIGYMVIGFYKERETSASRNKAISVEILKVNRGADVAATRADTERVLVDGAVRNDEKTIEIQGQVANRVVSIQESAESRQSRELEYRANAGAEILRQQQEQLKIANEQLKWERTQVEQESAARRSRERVISDKREIFNTLMSQGRIAEARAYAQDRLDFDQLNATQRRMDRPCRVINNITVCN